jgi:hypothetical protein
MAKKILADVTASGEVSAAKGLALPGTTAPIKLNTNAGSAGQVLTSQGASGTPTWTDPANLTSKPANTFLAGVASGTTVPPSFRTLDYRDIYPAGPPTVLGQVIQYAPVGGGMAWTSAPPLLNTGGSVSGALNLSTTTAPLQVQGSAGNIGQVLTSQGAGATPVWQAAFTGGTLTNALTLAAGTTSLSPVTFQSGTNLSTVTAGALEYDGAVFYKTSRTAAGRALDKQAYYYISSSDASLNFGTVAAQGVLGAPTRGITLGNGTYEYEVLYNLQGTFVATNQSPQISMVTTQVSGTNTITNIAIVEAGDNNTAFTNGVTLLSSRLTGANTRAMSTLSTGSRFYTVKMTGTIRIAGTGTTKIYPALTPSAGSASNTWTILSGAKFRVTPIGNDAVTTVGVWA